MQFWSRLDKKRWQCEVAGEQLSVQTLAEQDGDTGERKSKGTGKESKRHMISITKNYAEILCFKIDVHKWPGLQMSKQQCVQGPIWPSLRNPRANKETAVDIVLQHK